MRSSTPNVDVHNAHCRALADEQNARIEAFTARIPSIVAEDRVYAENGQSVLGSGKLPEPSVMNKLAETADEIYGKVPLLMGSNCMRLHSYPSNAISFFSSGEDDPLGALLEFMVHATPSQHLADSIIRSPSHFLDKMSVTMTPHLANQDAPASGAFEVEGVPDTTDKVRGRMAWIQVPKEGNSGEMGLELVWKVCCIPDSDWSQ
jgi:extracellular elastinolytic metalloproteinase